MAEVSKKIIANGRTGRERKALTSVVPVPVWVHVLFSVNFRFVSITLQPLQGDFVVCASLQATQGANDDTTTGNAPESL